MRTFKEYLLEEKVITPQSIHLPAQAEIVNVIKTDKGLMLLAIIKPPGYDTALPEIRTFKICSNDEIFTAPAVSYIGSFESLLGIRHVIEILKEY
jgi:hypothetical protein